MKLTLGANVPFIAKIAVHWRSMHSSTSWKTAERQHYWMSRLQVTYASIDGVDVGAGNEAGIHLRRSSPSRLGGRRRSRRSSSDQKQQVQSNQPRTMYIDHT